MNEINNGPVILSSTMQTAKFFMQNKILKRLLNQA